MQLQRTVAACDSPESLLPGNANRVSHSLNCVTLAPEAHAAESPVTALNAMGSG
jgi:hypothetical protein